MSKFVSIHYSSFIRQVSCINDYGFRSVYIEIVSIRFFVGRYCIDSIFRALISYRNYFTFIDIVSNRFSCRLDFVPFVKILVRWATGKRLTNYLPNLCRTKICRVSILYRIICIFFVHRYHIDSIFRSSISCTI